MTRTPVDKSIWTGRADTLEGAQGLRWHQVMRALPAALPASAERPAAGAGVALVGFACDEGVRRNGGRPGARGGPAAIRRMLANMPARGGLALHDAGDVTCDGEALEQAQAGLSARIAEALGLGLFPLALGGGHEIAFATFSGLAAHLAAGGGAPRIGVVNIDAHLDMRRDARATSGTPFLQIQQMCDERGWPFRYACFGASRFANTQALFSRAEAAGVDIMYDEEMPVSRMDAVVARLSRFLAGVDHVYLTIDLDALPAATAPGVSAPAARGVDIAVVEAIIDAVTGSGKLRVADLAEMNPAHDIDDRTARVAARLAARIAFAAPQRQDAGA